MAPSFDPRSPAVRADPYPTYAALRARDPVHHIPAARTWFVAGYRDCRAVLTDPRFSAAQGQLLRARTTPLPPTMLSADPPEHERLRAAVAPAFRPDALQRIRSWLRPLVDERVRRVQEALDAGEQVDLVSELAEPLAATTLNRFLGLAPADLEDFTGWAREVSVNLDPFADPDQLGTAAEAMHQLLSRCAEELYRPRDPDGALARLATSHDAGQISPAEALASAGLLVVGGFDPLIVVSADVVAALLTGTTPSAGAGVADVVAGGPPRAVVEELLRYDAVIQFTARRALVDVELGGIPIPAGDHVVVLLGSANRDPDRFDEPDLLRSGRRPNPQLSFGAGPHVCLGAPLVRLLGELMVAALPERGRSAGDRRAVVVEAVRSPGVVPRGHRRLVVSLDQR
ncbi:MAG TPA: cytochrome P450 [Microlunatus sp.]